MAREGEVEVVVVKEGEEVEENLSGEGDEAEDAGVRGVEARGGQVVARHAGGTQVRARVTDEE